MKVYVDELPKSCENCPCYSYSEGFCNCEFWWQKYKEIKDVQEYTHLGYKQNERPNDCPLQSLSDYTKQVRKEVVQEIKEKICMLAYKSNLDAVFIFADNVKFNKVLEILDQIQGDNND